MKNIVFVTADMPTDLRSGYKIRIYNIMKKLSEYYCIDIVHVGDAPVNSERSLIPISSYHFVRARKKNALTMLKSYLSNTPFLAYRFSPTELGSTLQGLLNTSNVEALYLNMTLYDVQLPSEIPVYVDQHDIISHTSREGAQGATSFIRRLVYKFEVMRWEKFERKFYGKLNPVNSTILSVKDSDRKETVAKHNIERCFTLVNGHSVDALPVSGDWNPELLFIGTSHERNVTALKKLYYDVLPILRKSSPELKLKIVGAFEAADLSFIDARSNNISIHTYVDDISEYYKYGTVQILPFTMGAGSKLKVFESFAYGVPVVGTKLAFTGVPADAIRAETCSDDPKVIADCVLSMVHNEAIYNKLSRKIVAISYDFHWAAILKDTCWIYGK